MEKDWILLYSTSQMYQAELIQQTLENEEIKVSILNKQDSAYLNFGSVEIYVHLSNKEKALNLIQNLNF